MIVGGVPLLVAGKHPPVPWSYVGAGAVVTGVGAQSALAIPAGIQAGDLLIVAESFFSTSGAIDIAGWTTDPNYTVVSLGAHLFVWYKIADGTETTVTPGGSGSNQWTAVCVAYRGIDDISPVDVFATRAATNSVPAYTNSVNTTQKNDLVVSIYADVHNAGYGAWGVPPGVNTRVDYPDSGFVNGILIVDENQALAGATTSRVTTAPASPGGALGAAYCWKQKYI